MKSTQLIITLPIILFASIGCKETLQPLQSLKQPIGYAKVVADFCTSPPRPARQKLKYLFIVDHSASNQPGFPNPKTPNDITNTDSLGSRRYGPMADFVRNLLPDPNNITSFALIDFNDDAQHIGTNTGFETDRDTFLSTVTADWIGDGTAADPAPYDSGYTNYQSALALAKQMIQSDSLLEATDPGNTVKTAYQIIFVSDGVPTVDASNSAIPYTQTFDDDLLPIISEIMNLKSDATSGDFISSITINTAYYFGPTHVPEASTLLQRIADEGNGKFLQFGSGQNILYQQFAPASRVIHNQLIDVFVENANAVWWDDGTYRPDTDGDGLPDVIEGQYGSSSNNPDSDGNGVSDLVEFRTKGAPCNNSQCSATGRDLYAICDGLSPTADGNGRVAFPSSSADGLNDCEKFVLSASRATFTTNGSMVPDLMLLKNSLQFIAGTAGALEADPFGDGQSNYTKLKLGLPILTSQKNLGFPYKTRNTSLVMTSSPNPDVDCFHFEVNNVAITAESNQIKVTLVENGTVIENKPFMLKATRGLDQQAQAIFGNEDFN